MFLPRLFLLLASGFVAATIIGTLSHEGGHWAVSELLGQQARIGYGYTSYLSSTKQLSKWELFAVTLAGPLQTMITGTLGLGMLWRRRNSIRRKPRLAPADWLFVFLALFWLRQTANAAAWLAAGSLTGEWSGRSDEIRLAHMLGLPSGLFSIATAGFGALVVAYVTFRVVPRSQRLTFLAAGLAGGVSGYLFWLEWAGPRILP